MKLFKYILTLSLVALTAASCLKGKGSDFEDVPEAGFEAAVSPARIVADGEEAAVFTAKYGQRILSADDVKVFDAADDSELSLPELRFTTETAGTYNFYLTYNDGAEEHRSKTLTVEAVEVRFTATVSPTTIYADGQSAAVFTAKFGSRELTAADVKVFDAADDSELSLPELRFTTETAGTYNFYLTYNDGAEEHRSETLTVEAVAKGDNPGNDEVDLGKTDDKGLTVSLSTTVIQAGVDRAVMVVRFDGEVLADGYDIYDAKSNTPADLPRATLTADDGTAYELPVVTASEAGTMSYWVAYKTHNTAKNPATVTAVTFAVPERPADSQPDNTSFVHRAMLTQFTGLGCGYCPYMIAALETLSENTDYASKYVLTVAHTYSGDPYHPGVNVDDAMGIKSYPAVVCDMGRKIDNYGYEANITNLKKMIDLSMAAPAKAGISAAMDVRDNTLVIRMTVKAAETNDYRVGAWVMEDGLSGHQYNYGMTGDYDFDTHNNVIRVVDSRYAPNNISGHAVGTLGAGKLADKLFVINLDPAWKQENMHVALFVTALDEKGNRYVTNVVAVDSLTGTIGFEYE